MGRPARPAGSAAALALLLASSLAAAEAAPTAEKQGDETEKMGGEYRQLNGHTFITPSLAFSAFTNTSFSFRQGGGAYLFEGVNASTGQPQSAKLFLYGQQFQVQIGIMNRVAIDIVGGGGAAVGGDLDTLLVTGALATLNVGAMPRVRLFSLDKIGLQVSAGVGVFYDRFIQVSPGAALTQAAESGNLNNIGASLLTQNEALSIVPAVMIAEGVGPFGAQLSFAPRIGVTGAGKTTSLDAALHLNFDLRRVSPVPLAVTAEYQALYDFNAGAMTHTVGPGVFYSGRRDFNLGLIALIAPPKDQQTFIQVQLGMQYFF